MSKITLKLKRLDPIKWATIMAAVYAILSLIIMIPMFLFMSVLGASEGLEEAGLGILGGGVMMLFLPVIYGVLGFIFGLIGAYIFNFVLGKTDGLEMDFEKMGTEVVEL